LATSYIGMYTRSKKGIKIRMETTIGLYGKGNEIISLRLPCFECQLLLHVCCRSTLHQICTNWINNDNIYQGSKIVSSDDNIHLFLCMAGGKSGKPLFLSEFHFLT
jgi:hypothetical protein